MISSEDHGDFLLLQVQAVRLDSAVGTLLRNLAAEKLPAIRNFSIDISQVKLVDSGGLGSLVALLKNITNSQGNLVLVGMNKPVRMMFELSRMDRQFTLLDDVSQAKAHFQSSRA